MASNGSKSYQFTNYDTLKWSWEVKSLDPAKQEATISWKAEIISGEYGEIQSTGAKAWTLNVMDYDKVASSSYNGISYIAIGNNETKTIASDTFVIGHTSSAYGRTTVDFSIDIDINFGGKSVGTVAVSCGFRLDAPPTGATISSAANFTDEENPSFTYTCDYLAADSLQVTLNVNGYSITRNVPIVSSGQYTIELTDDERNGLRNATPNYVTYSATYTLKTKYGSNTLTKSLSKTFTVVNSFPTVDPVITNDRGTNFILSHDNELTLTPNITALKGASIKSWYVSYDGKQSKNGKMTDVASSPVTLTVIDSRGLVTIRDIAVDLIPYIELTCIVESSKSAIKSDNTVDITFDVSGQFYNGSFNDGSSGNAVTLEYRYKWNNSSWTSYEWHSIDVSGNKWSTSIEFNIPYSDTLILEAKVNDTYSEVITTSDVTTVKPVFDWSNSDFNFNVPVTVMGAPIAYIVDQGSFTTFPNGSFYWRKWSDGTSEMWGRSSFSKAFQDKNWGQLCTTGVITESDISFPDGLFIETPNVVAQLLSRSVGGILMAPGGSGTTASTSSTGPYEIARGTYVGNSAFTICYNVKGRWS